MKKEKAKAGLILCSVVTASAAGLSQTVSATVPAFFSNLGQKIKDGAVAAAKGTWDGIKDLSAYVWEEAQIPILVGISIGFSKLSSKLPSGIGDSLWKIGKAAKDLAVSTWNSWSFGTQLVVGTTVVILLKKGYDKWKKAEIGEAIKERDAKVKKTVKNYLKDKDDYFQLKEEDQAPPPSAQRNGGNNNIFIGRNAMYVKYPNENEVYGNGITTANQLKNK